MSGTKAGALKASKKNKELYGEDFYSRIGAKGGSAEVPKGFALNKKLAREAGRRGGRISKRVKKSV